MKSHRASQPRLPQAGEPGCVRAAPWSVPLCPRPAPPAPLLFLGAWAQAVPSARTALSRGRAWLSCRLLVCPGAPTAPLWQLQQSHPSPSQLSSEPLKPTVCVFLPLGAQFSADRGPSVCGVSPGPSIGQAGLQGVCVPGGVCPGPGREGAGAGRSRGPVCVSVCVGGRAPPRPQPWWAALGPADRQLCCPQEPAARPTPSTVSAASTARRATPSAGRCVTIGR